MSKEYLFDAIRALTGHDSRVSAERIYCEAMGDDLAGGMFLSQLIFWSDKGKRADGYFYKTGVEWQEETYLSTYLVRKYTKQCEEFGWLSTKTIRANGSPTVHFLVDSDKFSKWIVKILINGKSNFSQSITDTTADLTTDISLSDDKGTQAEQPAPTSEGKTKHRTTKTRKPKESHSAADDPTEPETPEQAQWFEALFWLVYGHKDFSMLDKGKAAGIGKVAKALRADYTLDELRSWYKTIWSREWPGLQKNGTIQHPSLVQIKEGLPRVRVAATTTSRRIQEL